MNRNYFFYLLSFLEGTCVMAAELLGAKMLAPYFGTSLYVWSAVLGVTLGGLAMGYFAGGVLSKKKNAERNLYYILMASAAFLIMMPVTAKEVMVHTASFSLLSSILISSLIFLFPPVFFMGMVSPMVVQCVTSSPALLLKEKGERNSGKTAGTVYAISTVGGILATFLLGFYLIPTFGLTMPAIVMGIMLGIIPFIKLITAKKFFSLIFPLVALSGVEGAFSNFSSPINSDIKILYSSEGLLGQIIVADYLTSTDSTSQRILFSNRSMQTMVTNKNGEKKYFEYVNVISSKLPHPSLPSPKGEGKENQRSALVLGLGGGSVANELIKKGFHVDAVELDERMVNVAKKYFELDEKVNVHIDDARHYLNLRSQKPTGISQKLYDVIVLDAFIGEVNPHHLFTQEFFQEIKPLLSDSGTFFINGNGYWNGEAGKGMRSVCKTLLNSGFDVEIVPTGKEEDYRNLVFVAKPTDSKEGSLFFEEVRNEANDAIILTDEKPQLEILNAEANKRWREGCIKYFLSGYYSKRDVLLFK